MNYFTGRYANTRLLWAVVFALIIAWAATLIMVVFATQTPREYIYQTASGNFILMTGEELPDAKEIQTNCIRIAASALFNRTPRGSLAPVAIKQAFLKSAAKTVEEYEAAIQKDFDIKQIRQVLEISSIKAIQTKQGRYRAIVHGVLTQACQYEGSSFVQRKKLRAIFLLSENPNVRQNGLLPLNVYYIEDIRITDATTDEKEEAHNE